MLSEKDQKWLNHLSDTNPVHITPYTPKVKEVFQEYKQKLQSILGPDSEIVHMGATSLGISGKGDVDIYIPVKPEDFEETAEKLKAELGEPGSYYPLERVRWNSKKDDIDVEMFLINKESEGWTKSVRFHEYLLTHPDALEEYRKIKEDAEGLSTREYYRRKLEFMNQILEVT